MSIPIRLFSLIILTALGTTALFSQEVGPGQAQGCSVEPGINLGGNPVYARGLADHLTSLTDSEKANCLAYFQSLFGRGEHIGEGPLASVQVSLAKLGEEQALFEIACEARYGELDGFTRLHAVETKIPAVGGGFAVREYLEMLEPTKANAVPLSGSHDGVLPSARVMGIKGLAESGAMQITWRDRGGWTTRNYQDIQEFAKDLSTTHDEAVVRVKSWTVEHMSNFGQPDGKNVNFSDRRCAEYLAEQYAVREKRNQIEEEEYQRHLKAESQEKKTTKEGNK